MLRTIIRLHDCRFFSRHGLFEQEFCAGNEFSVAVEVSYFPTSPSSDAIEGTISYAELYEIVKQEMEQPRKLLETVCHSIGSTIRERFPQTEKVRVSITKLTPPIAGITGSAEVEMEFF